MFIAIGLGISLLCLAIFGSVVFFLAKGIASALDTVAHQLLGYRPPVVALRVASAACALALVVLLPIKGGNY